MTKVFGSELAQRQAQWMADVLAPETLYREDARRELRGADHARGRHGGDAARHDRLHRHRRDERGAAQHDRAARRSGCPGAEAGGRCSTNGGARTSAELADGLRALLERSARQRSCARRRRPSTGGRRGSERVLDEFGLEELPAEPALLRGRGGRVGSRARAGAVRGDRRGATRCSGSTTSRTGVRAPCPRVWPVRWCGDGDGGGPLRVVVVDGGAARRTTAGDLLVPVDAGTGPGRGRRRPGGSGPDRRLVRACWPRPGSSAGARDCSRSASTT